MKITLLDGREMAVYPKEKQPERIDGNNLHFDMTGQYMTIGKRGFYQPDDTIVERGLAAFKSQIFRENAWFLYENADRIMSESRMFLSPVEVGNHLAYFGTSGFRNSTIGTYIEWWLHFSENSIDKNGNLIWYMAGSPLSGANACSSVNTQGESVKMADGKSFSSVWRSFIDVNRLYSEMAQRCESYSLEETLIKLKGKDYGNYLKDLRQECIDYATVYNNKPNWPQDGTELKKKVKASRKTQMQIKWREIMGFYDSFSQDEEKLQKLKEEGNIIEYRKLLHEMAGNSTTFLSETFGRNVNRICLTDVINYAKYRKSLGLNGDE